MRGRKNTPTVIKMALGNPGKRKLNPHEPKPAALSTDCPEELAEGDARREWERGIVPAILRGQITVDDRSLAIAHCELWATWRSQLITAAKHAHVVAGKDGRPVRNPARLMANDTLKMLVRVDEVLGLSPTSRARVHVGNESGNALEAALA
jgi:P27 family predicted phage terminase small subunit